MFHRLTKTNNSFSFLIWAWLWVVSMPSPSQESQKAAAPLIWSGLIWKLNSRNSQFIGAAAGMTGAEEGHRSCSGKGQFPAWGWNHSQIWGLRHVKISGKETVGFAQYYYLSDKAENWKENLFTKNNNSWDLSSLSDPCNFIGFISSH